MILAIFSFTFPSPKSELSTITTSTINTMNPSKISRVRSLQWCHNERDGVSNHQPYDVHSTVYSGVDQRKHQSSASLAFVWGIHRWPVNSPQKASNAKNISIWWRHPVSYPTTFLWNDKIIATTVICHRVRWCYVLSPHNKFIYNLKTLSPLLALCQTKHRSSRDSRHKGACKALMLSSI